MNIILILSEEWGVNPSNGEWGRCCCEGTSIGKYSYMYPQFVNSSILMSDVHRSCHYKFWGSCSFGMSPFYFVGLWCPSRHLTESDSRSPRTSPSPWRIRPKAGDPGHSWRVTRFLKKRHGGYRMGPPR